MEDQYNPRIIIDENLSRHLLTTVNFHFPGSLHVSDVNLQHCTDIDIWDFSKSNRFIVLTKDFDYRYLSEVLGCPPKIIHLVCGNKTTDFIRKLLIDKIEVIQGFLNGEDDCYLELS